MKNKSLAEDTGQMTDDDVFHLVTVLVHRDDAPMFQFPATMPNGKAIFVYGTGLTIKDCADAATRKAVFEDTENALARYVANSLQTEN